MSNRSPVSHNTADYRHIQTYRVRYADLDTYRHVNNKAFLSYIEDARVHYLIEGAGVSHHQDSDRGVMVVHASIDYRSQIQPFETVLVYTRAVRIGGKSITLHHVVTARPGQADKKDAERIAATSVTVLASVDLINNTSLVHDPRMVDHITEYERVAPL